MTPPAFRIKICGITRPDDALWAAGAGADAVGLNFYARSPRCLSQEQAEQIVEVLPPRIVKVGLFVNAPVEHVAQTVDRLGLDLVQLHGDEPPDLLARLGDRPVMRALRIGPEGLRPVAAYLDECRRLGCLPRLVLLDAYLPGAYGGTGAKADWTAAAQYARLDGAPPLILAGGLAPGNVAQAVRAVRPAGVDTASGVELAPGRKDPGLVAAFVRAAAEAIQSLHAQ